MARAAKKARRKAAKRRAKPAEAAGAPEPFFQPFATLAKKKERAELAALATEPERPAKGRAAREPAKAAAKKPARSPGVQGAARADAVEPARAGAAAEAEAPSSAAPASIEPESFAVYMAGVRALDGAAKRIPRTASAIERSPAQAGPPPPDPDAEARAKLRSLVTEGLRFEVSDDGDRLDGRRLDVDPRELRKLRRAQYAIDGRLDLHGMTAAEARAALEAFVRKRRAEGDRVLLVVHGKGNHSPRGMGVLRGEIAAWLSQGGAARHVAAFASAPDDEGGTGAVLVLLAR